MVDRADEDLRSAAGRGDQDAFAVLVKRHHRAIFQFVQRFVGFADRDIAEDLAQDTVIVAHGPRFRV